MSWVIKQSNKPPDFINSLRDGSKISHFPMKSKTSSILQDVRSVIPEESPYIPQPPEVIKSQQIPEIDVSRLVPEKDFPEKLLELEERYAWLQRKIDVLTKRRDDGKISEETFLRLYEASFRDLYRTENYIKQLKKKAAIL